jgi:hypothetical protein
MGSVVVEVEGEDVASVAAQIPRADTLEPGTRVVVYAGKTRGWLGRILPPKNAPPMSAIGSALLALGYVGLGAGQEGGRLAVWAAAPS